jgi:hypothetical protein
VEDTGPGIAADRLEAIFEPFVQADMTLTRAHGGTGLGLAISRRLARLMDGDVTARSEVGLGSGFFLWLPAAPVESLRTGGLEGHGPGRDAVPPNEPGAAAIPEDAESDAARAARSGTLRGVGDAVLAELERILHAYVARLRSDPETPSARAVDTVLLEDHLASFLADLADLLSAMDAPGDEASAQGVRDSTAIQRVVAERHGFQRARLGWAERELRREFAILREELVDAVRRRTPSTVPGPTAESRAEEGERALEVLDNFLAVAERLSVESFRRALAERGNGAGDQGGARGDRAQV